MAARAEREELNGQKKERSQVKTDSYQSSILLFQHTVYEGGEIVLRSSSRVTTSMALNSKAAGSSSGRGRTIEWEAPPLSKQVSGRGDYISSLLLIKIKKEKAGLRQKKIIYA